MPASETFSTGLPTARLADILGDEIALLSSAIYAAEARLLSRLREFDDAGCYETLGFPSTAHWLNYRCGVGMNAAREKVRVAKSLVELPQIRAAFEKGRLSYSKVRAMTRVATPETDAYLLMIGEHATAHQVEQLVSKTRRATRAQDEVLAEVVYENRSLSVRQDLSGAIEIHGRFPAEQGALIMKALEFAMEREFLEGVTAVTSEAGEGTECTPGDVTAETRPTFSQRRADALVEVAETFLAHPDHSASTADRYQVVVHVPANSDGGEFPDVTAVTPTLENGEFLLPETAKRLACDCSTVTVTENGGEPLSIGRKSRSIPPAIRRALRIRDGACRFPGCTHTRFVDGHHIVHWADSGETSLDNLVLLCRTHHRRVHEGGVTCRRTDSGEIVFIDTNNQRIPDGLPLPGLADDLDAWLDRQVFDHDLDADSCRARMDASDRMDYDEASVPLLPVPDTAEWSTLPR